MCRGKRRESPTSHLSQQMQLLSFPLWSSRCLKVILEARLRYRLDNMHGGLGDCSAPSFQIFIVSSIYLSLYIPLKCDSASCAGNKVGKQLATRKSKCWMLLYCQESPVFWSAASPRTPLHCCQELCLKSLSPIILYNSKRNAFINNFSVGHNGPWTDQYFGRLRALSPR